MIRNYFKISWRNLVKNRTFALLNIGALGISLAACLTIYFWIKHEQSYDTSGANAERVFRVALKLELENQPVKEFASTAPPLLPALVKDFPQIEAGVRLTPDNPLIKVNSERFFTSRFFYADSTFFEVFGYPLLRGDPHTVLQQVNAAVITESIAKKYFGHKSPLGQIITLNDTVPVTITGVAKDLPPTNHFSFDIVVSMQLQEKQLGPDVMKAWWFDSFYTYILLKNAGDAPGLDKKIAGIIDKYNAKQNKEFGLKGTQFLQPLKCIHLHSDLRGELNPGGSYKSLQILGWIAAFLLLVACINYINLTTATSFKRAKEIGVKKVAGASFSQLMIQFLTESILIVFIATGAALVITILCLPLFNKLAGTEVDLNPNISTVFVSGLLLFSLLLGIGAGFFPAFYLSHIKPLITIRKAFIKPGVSFSLRKALVVFQFSITIVLIIATIIALQQLHYMQTRDLGFTKDQVVTIPLRNQAESTAKELLKKEFTGVPGITEATSSSSTPGNGLANITVVPEGVPKNQTQTMGTLIVDFDFFKTYDLKTVAGRSFSKEYGTDSSNFILNEAAVKDLGWGNAERAIGKNFNWGGDKDGKIIGVVKDYHFTSLQQKVQPMVMHILPDWFWYGTISVKVPARRTKETIQSLKAGWDKVLPGHPFDYTFLDENFNRQYKAEQQLGNLSAIFSVLIVIISCMGLLGLTIVAVSQRTKEIGVRKALGASVSHVATLVSKDFVKLVLIAVIIASPIAWWLMSLWLKDFAYRTNIKWWVFGVAGLLAIIIALITVSFQAIKAAIANPVKSLRTE
jgi:putative ABC transport system permease protein